MSTSAGKVLFRLPWSILALPLDSLTRTCLPREGGFTSEQYGLTGGFIALANVMFSLAALGTPAYINKFFPYYRSWLPVQKNDMLTLALGASTVGFLVVALFGIFFQDAVLERFKNSPGIDQYYYWIFPFGFGLTLFTVLEAYAWQNGKSVLTNFLKKCCSGCCLPC
jgi:hypothetical protein